MIREHSRAELRRKLLTRGAEAGLVEETLGRLEAAGYLSDERYTEEYIASRKRTGFGPVRIRLELRERGVDSGLVEAWLDERDEAWLELLEETQRQKYGAIGSADFKERAKRARFLEYRGFPAEMIRQVLWPD